MTLQSPGSINYMVNMNKEEIAKKVNKIERIERQKTAKHLNRYVLREEDKSFQEMEI